MMRNKMIEKLSGFRTPICEGLNAKLPDVEGLSDYLISEDVVAVVRCKNCKRWTPDGGHGLDLDGNKQLYGKCVLTNMAIKENNFCSFGAERSEE